MTSQSWLSLSELELLVGSFLQTNPCEAVAEVTYCPTKEKAKEIARKYLPFDYFDYRGISPCEKEPSSVAAVVCNPNSCGLNVPAPILVYPLASERSPEELVSIIRDHEYVHARDWFNGIPINSRRKITCKNEDFFSSSAIKLMMEVRAYKHQLKTIPENLKNSYFYPVIAERYENYCRALEKMEKTTLLNYEGRAIGEFLKFLRSKR